MAKGDGLEVERPVAASAEVQPDRQDLALIAVERMRMPMVVVDALRPEMPLVLANPAFLRLTGYSAEEVLGRNCRFLQGPDTSPDAVRSLREGLGRADTVNVELLNYRKDGATFWNAVQISPVRDHTGRLVYYFGSQWDVSDRRAADGLRAAEHRLLREVDHRAMNALSLVQGFVRLSRRDSVERFARAVEGRVEVLARTHTLLAGQGWADVALETLLLGELRAGAAGRAVLDGPTVLVSADRVQAFALLIHELASNATLHGALADPNGRVEVRWRSDHNPELVELTWQELGASGQRSPVAGFGLRLVSSIVRRQLQGSVRQAWGEDGLTTVVTCRLRAAAR